MYTHYVTDNSESITLSMYDALKRKIPIKWHVYIHDTIYIILNLSFNVHFKLKQVKRMLHAISLKKIGILLIVLIFSIEKSSSWIVPDNIRISPQQD